ncbi:MAG: enoyl-CoA hydratase/isomerase family protein [Firmicutes bacterium]|nr:enoyl-CoA hydratase/isomerase family protein [Bacillota bacterium]
MSDPAVAVEREGRVAVLTLSRPERRNALSFEVASALTRALAEADADPGVGAILLRGAGPDFCAGADIREFTTYRGRPAPAVEREGRVLVELMRTAWRLRTPLVAQVHGHALGGGCGLVAMSHMAVAASDARLGTTEIRLGLFPLAILPAMVHAVGARKALELGLTGRVMSAAEARDLGLVTEVVEGEALARRAMEVAADLAGKSPVALALGLEGYRAALTLGGDALEVENLLRVVAFLSEDLREGAQAFLERRTPHWTGE